MLNINDFFMNLEDIWPQISPINKFKTHTPKTKNTEIALQNQLWESEEYYISCMYHGFLWTNMTQWDSLHKIKLHQNNEHTALSLRSLPSRLSIWTSGLIRSVLPSTPWPSGFPHQHPHGWPLLLATAVLHGSKWPQAHLSWPCPASRHMLSAYGLPVLRQ